jgi:hypothetical protein
MKYWTSVSQQFGRVATRACTPVSCERAVFKLVKLRRRVLHDRATTRGGDGVEGDMEMEELVDRVMLVLDGSGSGREVRQEQVPSVAKGYGQGSEMVAIPQHRSSSPASPPTVKPVMNNTPQRMQLEETCNPLPIPILDRLNDLWEMQPIISNLSNRLELMEMSVQEVRRTCNSHMESMEEVLATVGEILTKLQG